jgi:hypothetical protein
MSVIAVFLMSAQPVLVAQIQPIPFTSSTDCRTFFIPMNADQQRPTDKRPRSKNQPSQRPQPAPRPCLTKASL